MKSPYIGILLNLHILVIILCSLEIQPNNRLALAFHLLKGFKLLPNRHLLRFFGILSHAACLQPARTLT